MPGTSYAAPAEPTRLCAGIDASAPRARSEEARLMGPGRPAARVMGRMSFRLDARCFERASQTGEPTVPPERGGADRPQKASRHVSTRACPLGPLRGKPQSTTLTCAAERSARASCPTWRRHSGVAARVCRWQSGKILNGNDMARAVLVIVVVMIFVSINPYAVKKLVALGATLLCLSTASCFADALFLAGNPKPATATRLDHGSAARSTVPAAVQGVTLPGLYDLPRAYQPFTDTAEELNGWQQQASAA